MTHFTLFVVLPTQELCALRSLPSGTTIKEIRNRLEMSGGLPGQVYKLTSSNGQVLHEEWELNVGQNVWDGFIVRVQLLDSWQTLYDAVMEGDVYWLLRDGAVCLTRFEEDDVDGSQVSDVVEERAAVALYLASWRGADKTCHVLLSAGVNPNGLTPFRRTALFAAVAKDNDRVLEVLLNHGAKTSVKDTNGETPLDVARRGFSRQCVNVMRSFQLRNGGKLVSPGNNGVNLTSPRSRSPASSCDQSLRPYSGWYSRGHHSPSVDSEVTSSSRPRTGKMKGIVRPRSGVSSCSSSTRRVQFHDDVLNGRLNIHQGEAPVSLEPHQENDPTHTLNNQQLTPRRQTLMPRTHMATRLVPRTPNVTHPSPRTPVATERVPMNHNANQPTPRTPVAAERAPRTPKAAQLRVAVTSPNTKSLEFSNVVKWNDGQHLDSEFLTIRPALREGKVQLTPYRNLYAPQQDIVNETANGGRTNSLDESFSASNDHQTNVEVGEGNLTISALNIDDFTPVANGSNWSLKDEDSRTVVSDPNPANRRIKSAGSLPGRLGAVNKTPRSGRIGSSPSFRRHKKLDVTRKFLDDKQTSKIRIHLAEQRKRQSKAALKKAETFETWLHRKRRQEMNSPGSTDSDGQTDGDSDDNNEEAFNSWLKKVGERPKSRQSHQNSVRFDPKRPQSIQGLVGMATTPVKQPTGKSEASADMTAFKEWKKRQRHITGEGEALGVDEAKRRLEEKRQQLLAMAITFDEWMTSSEERKRLLNVILTADEQKLNEIKQMNFSKRIQKNISFQQWRQKLEKRENLQRALNLRMRIEENNERQKLAAERSSAAVSHDEWLSRQRLKATVRDDHK